MRTMRLILTASTITFAATAAQADPRAPAVLAAVGAQAGDIGPDARYAIAFFDLNDDHHDEAIVHLAGQKFCVSGGCATFVLTETEAGWMPLGRMTSGRLPIYRLPNHHQGWFDLGVYIGGGTTQPGLRTVRFDGTKYRSNPAKGPAVGRLPQQATLVLPATSEFLPLGQ